MPEHTPAPTPSRAVYGFVLFLGCKALFFLYIIWALVPEDLLELIHITYLPQRYWAVAIPIFLLTVLTTFAFIIYPSINLCMTPNIADIRTVTDNLHPNQDIDIDCLKDINYEDYVNDKECICKLKSNCSKEKFTECYKNPHECPIPVMEDLCIGDVSRILYLK